MSKEAYNIVLDRKTQMRADVTYLMLKGAGYAAMFVFAIWLAFTVVYQIGQALPEDSKTAPDPINRSSLEIAAPLTDVV